MSKRLFLLVLILANVSSAENTRAILWNNETDQVLTEAKKQTKFRFETHGKSTINLNYSFPTPSDKLSYELVLLPSGPDKKERRISENSLKQNKINIDLDEAGVYELRVKNKDQKAVEYSLSSNCVGFCGRKMVKISEFANNLSDKEREEFGMLLENKLKEYGIEDPEVRNILKNRDFSKLDKLATVLKLSDVKEILPILKQKGSVPEPDVKIHGNLSNLLKKYPVDTSKAMIPVFKKPVAIEWGHPYSQAFTQKQLDQSEALGHILTSLSVENGSSVTVKSGNESKKLTSPEQLFQYLLETGHEIKLDFEKVNANFLSFAQGQTNIVFPTWVKTGIKLPSGKELTVPMNHTQLVWKINGPLVNARVTAYHGISGVAFFSVNDDRPDWSKAEVKTLLQSRKGENEEILKAVTAAKNLIRLNRCERETLAKGAPADGYGILGVCNDSTAYLLTQFNSPQKPPYPYPLIRPSAFNENPCHKTGSDPYTRVPHDADEKSGDKIALLERVLASVPRHMDGSLMYSEPELVEQVHEAEALLKSLKESVNHDSNSSNSH